MIGVWIVLLPTGVWQMLGLWRSATKYSSKNKGKPWGTLAKIATVIGIAQLCNTSINQALPQIQEYWRIAIGDTHYGDFEIRILRDASELEVSGQLAFGVTEDVEEHLDAHPTVRLIHLNSGGGRIAEARSLARLIEERDLATYTYTGCYSACIIPYAAGRERLLSKNGVLGFHQYRFPGSDQDDFATEYDEDKKYLRSRGIQDEFIQKIFSKPPDDFWMPKPDELMRAGFVTGYAADDEVAVSGVKLTELEKLNETLLAIPLYAALKEREPQTYDTIVSALRSAYLRGHSVAEVRKKALPLIQDIYMERLPYASDDAVVSFARVLIKQSETLRAVDPLLCYRYNFSDSTDSNISHYLPNELIWKEMDVGAQIIRTFSQSRNISFDGEMEKEIETFIIELIEIYGEDILLLADESHSIEDQPRACDAIVFWFSSIVELPSDESARMLRYLWSQS